LKTSFYLVLTNKVIGYLAGDAEEAGFNYAAGQSVLIALSSASRAIRYTLQGPHGLRPTETTINRAEGRNDIALPQAVTPGNYALIDADGKQAAAFSVNLPAGETDLARVPAEQIEALFGPDSILAIGLGTSFRDALQG